MRGMRLSVLCSACNGPGLLDSRARFSHDAKWRSCLLSTNQTVMKATAVVEPGAS